MAKVRVRTMRVVHTMNGSTVLFYSFQNPPHNGEMGDTVRASVHAQRGNIQETLKITRPLALESFCSLPFYPSRPPPGGPITAVKKPFRAGVWGSLQRYPSFLFSFLFFFLFGFVCRFRYPITGFHLAGTALETRLDVRAHETVP